MPALRLGSLCTGAGMLDDGVQAALGPPLQPVWQAEVDPDASAVLAARNPDIPNLGDITGGAVARLRAERPTWDGTDEEWVTYSDQVMRSMAATKWAAAPPVDVLCGGWPCQANSLAGRQLGAADERHLWPAVASAVAALRPQVFVGENVPGLLSVDGGQGFAAVLTDLNQLGYTVVWDTVGACKVGAPHHRHRVFLYATLAQGRHPANTPTAWQVSGTWVRNEADLFGNYAPFTDWPPAGMVADGSMWPRPADPCGAYGAFGATLPTPQARDGDGRGEGGAEYWAGRAERRGRDSGAPLGAVVTLLPTPNAALGRSVGFPSRSTAQGRLDQGRRFLDDVVALLPTPNATDGQGGMRAMPARRTHRGVDHGPRLRDVAPLLHDSAELALSTSSLVERWGRYAPAIARWVAILGRPAPDPTELGTKGQPRLSPVFVEWMMGVPQGLVVSDPAIIGRNAAIRVLGNGVVAQAAAYALRRITATGPVGQASGEAARPLTRDAQHSLD